MTDPMNTRIVSERQLEDLFDAFNRHDIDAVMCRFATDAIFEAVGGSEVYGTRFEGLSAIGAAFENVWKTMTDAHWAHRDHLIVGDRAVSEWTFSGTNPDGSRIEADGVDLFHLCDGLIVRKQAFRKQRPLLAK